MKKPYKNLPKIIYAGDRDISVWVLEFLLKQGARPIALMLPDEKSATHSQELTEMCGHLDNSRIFKGIQFREKNSIDLIKKLKPDYIMSVHFPYIFPKQFLKIPTFGVLNLHPAYLPYNRGWHTPTWAIWERTPYGATLHFMDEGIDTGDIIHQKRMRILPTDTADILYARVKRLELEVFKEAWPLLVSKKYLRKPQPIDRGTFHKKEEIKTMRHIDLNAWVRAEDLIRRLRALTTNKIEEAAYFEVNGRKYHAQISITEEKPHRNSKSTESR